MENITVDDDEFDTAQPKSKVCGLPSSPICSEDRDWASYIGLLHLNTRREGATFVKIADNVFIIGCYGAQYLHHDRHLQDMDDQKGFSHHTWNLVVEPSDHQMLLTEDDDGIFTHHRLNREDQLIYMNTFNRHMISRTDPFSTVVIVQVDGIPPDRPEDALAALAAACAKHNVLCIL